MSTLVARIIWCVCQGTNDIYISYTKILGGKTSAMGEQHVKDTKKLAEQWCRIRASFILYTVLLEMHFPVERFPSIVAATMPFPVMKRKYLKYFTTQPLVITTIAHPTAVEGHCPPMKTIFPVSRQ